MPTHDGQDRQQTDVKLEGELPLSDRIEHAGSFGHHAILGAALNVIDVVAALALSGCDSVDFVPVGGHLALFTPTLCRVRDVKRRVLGTGGGKAVGGGGRHCKGRSSKCNVDGCDAVTEARTRKR